MIRDKKEQTEKELLNTGKLFVHSKTNDGNGPDTCAPVKRTELRTP